MRSKNVRFYIIETINQLVQNNKMFTAFDITRQVWRVSKIFNEHAPTFPHRAMKSEIHNFMQPYVQQGVYLKTLIDVGADTPAYVYHPINSDATTYVSLMHNSQMPPPVHDGDLKEIRSTDARGTLCIPAYMVRQIANSGDNLYVIAMPEKLILSKQHVSDISYKIDEYCNARITEAQLKILNNQGNEFEITKKNDTIVITNG